MQGKKIIIVLIIINILLVCFIYNFIKNDFLNNEKLILKAMTDIEYEDNITSLNQSHTEYANYIEESKKKIASVINIYQNDEASEQNSLEELSTMISNLTNIPENTYFYESGTEGDSSTIIRYKKIGEEYYKCDEHGIVQEGTTATDVSSLTLSSYSSTESQNLSAGSAGYASGKIYLGDGTDSENNAGYELMCIASSKGGASSTKIDVKSMYPDEYSLFTDSNFIYVPTKCTTVNVSYEIYGGWLPKNYTISHSYNQETGILTINNLYNESSPGTNAAAYSYIYVDVYLLK